MLIIPESHSEITTIVFRGASTLITASKEGYVSNYYYYKASVLERMYLCVTIYTVAVI